ncbi:MAG: hypothetical protein JW967_04660 [Dehalococcoidales bacterium]|nr:hypothetical protein [Dehalococcoidales bacterium]
MSKSKRRQQYQKANKTPVVPTETATTATAKPAATKTTSPATPRQSERPLTVTARHPYVTSELKRIGILTLIMLVVLFVLAFILPRFI